MIGTYSGSCFCGAVTVQVSGAPVSEGFCHCNDCRSWSGTPVTAYALWPAPMVEVTQGADRLQSFNKAGTTDRVSCAECGALILADLPDAGLKDVFPLRLQGREFAPQAHVHYASRIVDMKDGLPKFADLPEGAGGTGQMIDE